MLLSGYFRQNQESACGKAEARRFCGKFCNLWIPEGPQQSYQTNRGRTGSGNSAEHLSLEDQWHEQSGHRKSFECEKGTVPSCTKLQSGAKLSLHFRKSDEPRGLPRQWTAFCTMRSISENWYRERHDDWIIAPKEIECADAGLGNRGQYP